MGKLVEIEEWDCVILADFVGQNWANFVEFCHINHGMSEAECEDIANRLEKARNADY